MKFICPLLVVKDIERSKEFYTKILDRKIKVDFGENITFEGDFSIHLDSHYTKLIDNKEVKYRSNNFELYFEYDAVTDLVTKLKENKVNFVHEMREQAWRQIVVRFYDPDYHIIEVGESMEYLSCRLFSEGHSFEEISKITYLPVEYVKTSIESYKKKIT